MLTRHDFHGCRPDCPFRVSITCSVRCNFTFCLVVISFALFVGGRINSKLVNILNNFHKYKCFLCFRFLLKAYFSYLYLCFTFHIEQSYMTLSPLSLYFWGVAFCVTESNIALYVMPITLLYKNYIVIV